MSKTQVDVCIIPAAGKGSRWAPISGYLPKEMLPLIDRPVLDWVIDEAKASGCKEIIIVINKQKQLIKDYLINHQDHRQVKFHFVYQEKPLGITHAMLLCQKIIKDRPFAMALPDLPTISHKPVLKQLVEAYEKQNGKSHIISFSSFPGDTLHFYTECLIELRKDKLLDIIHFCPKQINPPRPHHPGSKLRMSGRYVFNPEIFSVTEKLMKNFEGSEANEVVTLKEALEIGQNVLGLDIDGHTYDTGNPTLYVRANTAFFKRKISKKK